MKDTFHVVDNIYIYRILNKYKGDNNYRKIKSNFIV